MADLTKKINQIKIYIYAYLKHLFLPKYHNKDKRELLIIFTGALGDTILLSNSINQYSLLFPEEKGYHISILCRNCSRYFFTNVFKVNKIKFHNWDLEKSYFDFRYYKSIVKYFKGKQFDTIVVPQSHARSDRLAANITAGNKIAVQNDIDTHGRFFQEYFKNHTYTKVIRVNPEMMELKRFKLLMNELGDTDFLSGVPHIDKTEVSIHTVHDRYIMICLGSQEKSKIWSMDNFAELINRLVMKYRLPIYISGGKEESYLFDLLFTKITYKSYISNYIGKTSYSEWIELIRGSALLIGNDSAAIHIATATGRPSVCIIGGWDYTRFQPYDPDIILSSDVLPVIAGDNLKKYPCYGCSARGSKKGYQNPSCENAINHGEACLCIQDITVDEVYTSAVKCLNSEKEIKYNSI